MEACHAFFEGFNHLFLNIGCAIPGFAEFIHNRIQAAITSGPSVLTLKSLLNSPLRASAGRFLGAVQAFLNHSQQNDELDCQSF